MSDSLNERALRVVEQRLAAMPCIANAGSANVFRARRTLDETELPAVVIWDDGESPSAGTGSGSVSSMTMVARVSVDAHVRADHVSTGQALGAIKAAVKAALCVGNGAVSDADGKVGVLTYIGADVSARTDGASSEAISLHFELTYKEAYGDPARTR